MTKDLSPVMCDHDGKPAITKAESNTTNVVNGNQCQESLPDRLLLGLNSSKVWSSYAWIGIRHQIFNIRLLVKESMLTSVQSHLV